MLRFPSLYYEYVGQYKKNTGGGFGSMRLFLEKQIVSTEYRRLLKQEMESDQDGEK